MKQWRWLRGLSLGLLLALLAMAVVTFRAVHDGEEQMRQSDAAFNRGDLLESMLHARSAAVLYAPGAPHVTRAYARLQAIAVGAEAAGQRRTAEAAWRAMRGAALETRHVWVPRAAELARANENLLRLQQQALPDTPDTDPKAAAERARRDLGRDDAPSTTWLGVLIAGFVSAALGLVWVGLRGVTAAGELTLGRAKLGILLSILGAACWTVAVWRA